MDSIAVRARRDRHVALLCGDLLLHRGLVFYAVLAARRHEVEGALFVAVLARVEVAVSKVLVLVGCVLLLHVVYNLTLLILRRGVVRVHLSACLAVHLEVLRVLAGLSAVVRGAHRLFYQIPVVARVGVGADSGVVHLAADSP